MESQSRGDELGNNPLLRPTNDSIETDRGGVEDRRGSCATTVVVLSTVVALLGSFVFGCCIGFSSPAQSGILDDLALSLAQGKMGRWDDSKAALQHLRGKNANIYEEAAEIREYTESLAQLSDSKMMDLFQRKYAHSLTVGVGLMVLQQFGGVNAIAYYASSIFSSAGFSSRAGTTAMVFIQVPMTLLGVLLMDKSGRRLLLLVSAAGTCLGCLSIGLSYMLQARFSSFRRYVVLQSYL